MTLEDGETLTAIPQPAKLAATSGAFALIRSNGTVVARLLFGELGTHGTPCFFLFFACCSFCVPLWGVKEVKPETFPWPLQFSKVENCWDRNSTLVKRPSLEQPV